MFNPESDERTATPTFSICRSRKRSHQDNAGTPVILWLYLSPETMRTYLLKLWALLVLFGVVVGTSDCSSPLTTGRVDRVRTSWHSRVSQLNAEEVNRRAPVKTIANPFFEKSIDAYVAAGSFDDVVVKSGGFVESYPTSLETYQQGYFIVNFALLSKLKRAGRNLKMDSAAVMRLWVRLDSLSAIEPNRATDLNPFCGSFYRRQFIQLTGIYLGKLEHRLPLFGPCDAYQRDRRARLGKNYQLRKVPTYLIISAQ